MRDLSDHFQLSEVKSFSFLESEPSGIRQGTDKHIQDWKSYPGVKKIIDIAREMITTGDMKNIDKLATMMQCHESQQSASIIATVAIIIGNQMNSKEMNVDEEYRRAIGDIILWDTPVLKIKMDGLKGRNTRSCNYLVIQNIKFKQR